MMLPAYDDGLVWFAGNRSELTALIGETAVDRWEADMSERKTEAGE